MINFILIFICVAAGIILSQKKILPADAYKSVNAWLLYIALPSLALRFVPEIHWGIQILLPILAPILVWVGAWCFVNIYDYKKRLSSATRTALLVACGLGNTAFLGFPLISAFYGESEIRNAVVFDQITFLLFSTVSVIVILKASSEKSNPVNFVYVVKKVFRFPPFIACLTALILPNFWDFSFLNPLLDKLVATMSPMALFSIGLQFKIGAIKEEWKILTAGLIYKLILAPCLVLLLTICMQAKDSLAQITIFEASMSSHITASLLASQYNLNPKLCSLMVGVGILANFVTSAGWYWVLEALFVR